MKNTLKKLAAGVSIAALLTIQSAFAAGLSLTGTTTNLTLTGTTATVSGSTATGELSVQVTATVLPTLTFDISSDTLDLGDLVVGDYATTTLTYTGVTNARTGMNVTIKSNLLDDGNGNTIGAGSASNPNTDYKFVVDSTVDDLTGTSFDTTNQALDEVLTNGQIDGTLNIGAKIAADTIAGDYTDTLVFTVTGNF